MMHAVRGLVFLVMLGAAGAHAADISSVAASVNDEVITTRDVEKEALPLLKQAERKGELSPAAADALRKEALQRLIDKKLVEQKVRELNIRVTQEEITQAVEEVQKQNNLTVDALASALAAQGLDMDLYRAQIREQLERVRLLGQEVRAKVQVTPEDVRRYYEAHRGDYVEEDTLQGRVIFFRKPKDTADMPALRARADKVLGEIAAGADFGELAKKYSEDSTAADGGSLGNFRASDMLPQFQEIFARLKPGQVSPVVETPSGLHIVKLEQRTAGKSRSVDEVRQEIEEKLYRTGVDERFMQWLGKLKADAVIEIVAR